MDQAIRVYDAVTQNLVLKLEGHTKGVISFSWTSTHKLVSGGWDGSARIWDLDLAGACLMELTGHENGVQVLGLPSGHILTTSTGESVNSKPANFQLRMWDPTDGEQLGESRRDHAGPIRSICGIRNAAGDGTSEFATSSNDGSIRTYIISSGASSEMEVSSNNDESKAGHLKGLSSDAIEPRSCVFHAPSGDDNSPPFVLGCASLLGGGGGGGDTSDTSDADMVSCAEDGSVCVWNTSDRKLLQTIQHPSCTWCVLALPGDSGDFVTGSHDGTIRWFSRRPEFTQQSAAVQLNEEMKLQVASSEEKQKKGPSREELAKCALWDDRGTLLSKSEGTVMVFNKAGKMVAAQMTNGNWVEIGEVTGNGDGGEVRGVYYDHVMPVEMDAPGGGTASLQLGFNDAENAFIAAQRFIEQNEIGQHFLQQIADWILERSGRQQTPTLGVVGDPTQQQTHPQQQQPLSSVSGSKRERAVSVIDTNGVISSNLTTYITTTDVPPLDKLLAKTIELHGGANSDAIESLLKTLKDSSKYHISEIRNVELSTLFSAILASDADKVYPVFDIARLGALHPHASSAMSKAGNIQNIFTKCFQLLQSEGMSNATILTSSRFLVNCFRYDDLRVALLSPPITTAVTDDLKNNRLKVLLAICEAHCGSTNKSVRVSIANLICNIALSVFKIPEFKSLIFNTDEVLLEALVVLQKQLRSETENLENIFKCLCALGTILYRGGSILQDKVMGYGRGKIDGIMEMNALLDIVETNWAGKSNALTNTAVLEVRAMLK